ncbi:MAG: amidohydrolase [Anaerolineaceae bacterium]|nr:amidohydrolase [Anaerolineaceae bacterium]
MSQKDEVKNLVAAKSDAAVTLAKQIWGFAELAYKETQSAAAIVDAIQKEGFQVEMGIADIPTAFTATYKCGSGKPVMGFLAEYDALDGLSQEAGKAEQCAIVPGGSGHGCGHNLLGSGAWLAAVATKDYLVKNNLNGTVILFGCPAEEGAGSKQFIARAGYFDNVDFAYTWHPAYLNRVGSRGSVAIMGANFIFDGIASHAGGAPHLGRSALDACELMNVGVNYLREHMIDEARVHYAYSDAGGTAPNVVPAHAVIKYEVRAPKVKQMKELFTRVTDIAKGAALMTGTKMKYEIAMAFSDYTPNKTLAAVMDECLQEFGAPEWTDEDYQLASAMLRSYPKQTQLTVFEDIAEIFGEDDVEKLMRKPLDSRIHPFDPKDDRYESGSTDVGDVGYATPTVELNVATACLGNVGHTWQNTAFSCSPIGFKGMIRAAEVMTLAAIRTMEQPELIEKARKELLKKNGGKYVCPLPDYIQPPIETY